MKQETGERLQESAWIEIISQMERMYAELANTQAEIEEKSRELQEAKEFTDNIIASMVDALIVVDSLGNIRMVNKATLDLLGYQENEIIGKPVQLLLDDESSRERLFWGGTQRRRLFKASVVRDLEVDCRKKTGESIPMTFSGSTIRNPDGEIVGAVAVAKDLRQIKSLLVKAAEAEAEHAKATELGEAYAELQQLQAQLIQAEKMASVGKLAAGVAHEINNPLAGILLYGSLVLEDLPPDAPIRKNIEKMMKQTTRCKDIVKGLLDFARQAEPKIELHDINKLVEETLSLIQSQSLFHNIRVNKTLSRLLPHIAVDGAQIQQVFMNIILNAADAMEEHGDLNIETSLTDDGRFVTIRFSDTGCGIPAAILDKIFEPFFTTKSVGNGTGLGLAICYGIVQRHGGTIDVRSEVGSGATFIVKLLTKKES